MFFLNLNIGFEKTFPAKEGNVTYRLDYIIGR